MDNQTVCPNCQESDKGCVQYGCWKRTPSTREEALQRIIADLEFHMSTGTLCPNLDVERGVRAVLDEVKRLREANERLSAELDKGDSWTWIRDKFDKCGAHLRWYTPRTDALRGTRYEVMGWLHCLFADANPTVFIDITLEHQKRTDIAEKRVTELEADLQAMTVDRNLWQEAHDDDCPNKAENTSLKAQIAAYEMPVSDTQYPPSDAHLAWEYRGEGLYLTWLNPFNANRKEDVAMFMWPSHAPEVTSEVERLYEAMAASFVEAWKLSRKLPPPAITDADAKQQAIKDRQP